MNTDTHVNSEAAQRPFDKIISAATPPKSDPAWKPQPCGLSREELRKIVAEILG